jgi:hypothetical protein
VCVKKNISGCQSLIYVEVTDENSKISLRIKNRNRKRILSGVPKGKKLETEIHIDDTL